MNLDQEFNRTESTINLEDVKFLPGDKKNRDFINQEDSIHILYFSGIYDSDQFVFDLISHQCNSNWKIDQSSTIEETSLLVIQHKIKLILVHYDSLQIDKLHSISRIGIQANIPILAILPEESEAIATTAISLGAQDYITIEELQDSKIFQRIVLHTIIRNYSIIKDNILPHVIDAEINDFINIKNLRQDEEQFHLISEHVPIGIFQLDALGNSIYTNTYLKNFCSSNSEVDNHKSWIDDLHPEDRAYLENIGVLESDNKQDQSWMKYIHPDDSREVLQSFEDFINGTSLFHCEFRLIRSQSDIRWVLSEGITLKQSNGETMGYVGTITDITERKQAEENLKQLNTDLENRVFERTAALQQINLELRIGNKIREFHEAERQRAERALYAANDQLQAVLDAVPGCVAWVNADLTYLGVNRLMAETFKINATEFIGKKIGFIDSNTQEYIGFAKNFFDSPEENISKELLFQFNGSDDKFYLLIGQKYSQGESAVFVTIEITERKRAEVETQNALEKVKELSDLKSRFIFMVSHEFRTPLTSIFSASELLEHYGDKWSFDKKLKYLQQIQESVQRMNGLLEDVLIIGAEESGKLKLQPTELNLFDFCQQLIEEIQLSKNNSHLINFNSITQFEDIRIDAKILRHILSNLLSNAVKYSPDKIPIDFDLSDNNQEIVFAVTDYGIGIPLKDQTHLFDLFHRASNVGTIGGTGIGLSIVKKSVDALGGSISFQSDINVGSKFTVSIPVKQIKEDYQW